MDQLKLYVARWKDGTLELYLGVKPPERLKISSLWVSSVQDGSCIGLRMLAKDHSLGEGLTWEDEPRAFRLEQDKPHDKPLKRRTNKRPLINGL